MTPKANGREFVPNDNDGDEHYPDLMTQTDKYGKASSPRPQKKTYVAQAVSHPNNNNNNNINPPSAVSRAQEESAAATAETQSTVFSFFCCCLANLSPQSASSSDSNSNCKTPQKLNNTMANSNSNSNSNSHINGDSNGNSSKQEDSNAANYNTPQKNENFNKMYPNRVDSPSFLSRKLLKPQHSAVKGKKCLVLDLDETLVHSSFRAVPNADFVIPVNIEDQVHYVYVAKRPGVENFLKVLSEFYELVIYTASLNKYADPLLDLLDTHKTISARLFRESCVHYEGNYVKDLSIINRDLTQSIIIDNSPQSYIFQPENAIDCSSFIDDPMDRELDQIMSFLLSIKDEPDVRHICTRWNEKN
ncbi:hypothetical protein ScalyP_jg11931 [Parmales sp. scaly parma]|nr:hypothetical protein ScalyP_jg11931 [Parmales sp. scaly parma]